MKTYYQLYFVTTHEVIDGYGGLLTQYTREVIRPIFSMSKEELKEELSKIPIDEVEAFYENGKRVKVYIDEVTHHKWLAIPRKYKKQAQYLITKKLLEKLKEVEVW